MELAKNFIINHSAT